jgi:spermidine synthase
MARRDDEPVPEPLPGWLAVVLVVGTSASVLVLEILAGRLLAPYVGVSLETYTGIIGTVLAGIALGAWAGGTLADRMDPRRLIPMLLLGGGALALASIPIVRSVGAAAGSGATVLVLATVGFLPSAAVLSAVPPVVVKLQLHDLAVTGSTVGRLSAYGTAGAIVGTFLTGFVLVAWAAVTTLIVTVGVVLMAAGAVMWAWAPAGSTVHLSATGGLAALSVLGVVVIDSPCEVQTSYYCVSVRADPDRPSGRTLVLDDVRHSYVDVDDDTHLEFWYVRRLADAAAVATPDGPLHMVHVGAGALTLPRYFRATRPGSTHVVLEIDDDLVGIVEERLGYAPGADIAIRTGDARSRMTELATDSADVVIGDGFGGRAVPWQLATQEFVADVARVLRPMGVYAANVIDSPRQQFLRAEAATIASVFEHVVVIRGPGAAADRRGNSVIIASDRPIDVPALERRRLGADDGGAVVGDLAGFISRSPVLTDDFAPVDQLIARGN